jgi:hypothetical protein
VSNIFLKFPCSDPARRSLCRRRLDSRGAAPSLSASLPERAAPPAPPVTRWTRCPGASRRARPWSRAALSPLTPRRSRTAVRRDGACGTCQGLEPCSLTTQCPPAPPRESVTLAPRRNPRPVAWASGGPKERERAQDGASSDRSLTARAASPRGRSARPTARQPRAWDTERRIGAGSGTGSSDRIPCCQQRHPTQPSEHGRPGSQPDPGPACPLTPSPTPCA